MLHHSAGSGLADSTGSGSGECSSTPHAPRLLHRPLRFNSTHAPYMDLSYKPLSDTHITSSPHTEPPVLAINSAAVSTPGVIKMKWNSPKNENIVQKKRILVQPYRSRTYKIPPKIVPELDLRQLNQPDHLLKPMEVLDQSSSYYSGSEPTSSMSWGMYKIPMKEKKNEYLQLIDCEEDNTMHSCLSSATPPSSLHTNFLKKSQLEFIEGKLMSYERSRAVLACTSDFTSPEPGGGFPPSACSPYPLSSSLEKKLQFEARIATHNGRDVHRQLCGYFFLDDSSLTIYEFRQFGKKYSALPLIHRGIYHVCSGRKKGCLYKISHIRKGSNLQFATDNHPNLPASLLTRPILHIRVVKVNEELKKELVCTGCERPEEIHKRLQPCLASPPTSSARNDACLLATMQGMLCHRLTGRACLVLVGLGRHLLRVAKLGVVTFNQLEQALRTYHISLTTEDMTTFWSLLRGSELWNETPEGLYLDFLLHALTGVFTEDHISLVRQIFMKLDIYKSGLASFEQMEKLFSKPDSKSWQDMQSILQQKSAETISYADFEHFYLGLRLELSSNSKFINELKSCWGI